jgi:hypothetical protein
MAIRRGEEPRHGASTFVPPADCARRGRRHSLSRAQALNPADCAYEVWLRDVARVRGRSVANASLSRAGRLLRSEPTAKRGV